MADYYATALHEHPHWSGAEHRLDRPLVNRLGTEEYAQEELIVRRVGAMKGVKIR
jgi:antirestriction protein ArdC